MTEKQIKTALKKDFKNLYVPQYSTHYLTRRTIVNIEIDIMPIENLKKLFNKKRDKQ